MPRGLNPASKCFLPAYWIVSPACSGVAARNLTPQPVVWREALAAVTKLNHEGEGSAWRLPTINELESLVDCAAHSPALSFGHPFADVQDIYWSSSTSLFEPDWAWALYLEKGATGVGQKRFAQFSVWAVTTVG